MYDKEILERAEQSQEDILSYINSQLKKTRSDKPEARAKLLRRKEQTELILMLIEDKLCENKHNYMSFGGNMNIGTEK